MKIRLMTAAMAAAITVAGAVPASAGDQDFTLVNRTGFDVREVYVSPSKSKNWGRDVLGSGMLHDGRQIPIKFKTTNTVCKYDLKVIYTDDDEAEWADFNLCEISKISISYNPRTRMPVVSTE